MNPLLNEAVKELVALLKIDSVETAAEEGMPFGKGNADCLEAALSLMTKYGLKSKNIENYCGYGEIGEGELFGVLCHLDVVPVGEGWKYEPFKGEIVNNTIYGRGALDNKGPFIASLFALISILKEGFTPKKRIRFILGCDEESGWKCMERYAKTEEIPASGFSPDGDFPVINCEKGIVYHEIKLKLPKGLKELGGGTRANVVPPFAFASLEYDKALEEKAVSQGLKVSPNDGLLRIEAKGTASHASHPEDGDNAIIKLLQVLAFKYEDLKLIYNLFKDYNGNGTRLNLQDKESGLLTLNLGTARVENDDLIFKLDIRHPITYTKEEITKILKNSMKNFDITQGDFHLPLYVSEDNPLIVALLAAYNKVTGENRKPITIGGGTYARFLPLGSAFGPILPGQVSTIHQADECVTLEHMDLMIEIYKEALMSLCF